VFDKACVDFVHLWDLTGRGVFWVMRAKDNMQYRVRKRLLKKPAGNILRDDLIVLTGTASREKYPQVLRLVRAIVEVDGQEREMEFLTNNLEWAASSIAELYKSRWQIEVFFKEIKQTLQLCDFLGQNRNAVLWQVWTALILYVLLRFLAFANSWQHGFKRFFCPLRSSVWDGVLVSSLASLRGYGTTVKHRRRIPVRDHAPRRFAAFLIAALAMPSWILAAPARPLILCCSAGNDLFRVASDNGMDLKRFNTAEAAIEAAGEGNPKPAQQCTTLVLKEL